MREFTQLGIYLQKKRLEKNLTQNELAHSVGKIHTQFVSNWERGLCAPPSHAFAKLIEVLKIDQKALVEIMLQDSLMVIQSKVYKKAPKKKRA